MEDYATIAAAVHCYNFGSFRKNENFFGKSVERVIIIINDDETNKTLPFGREPWSSGYGRRRVCEGRGFESLHRILDGHF